MRDLQLGARARPLCAFLAVCVLIMPNMAKAADPIRVGMSMALTGGVAPIGKQVLTALQIWRDDVNAKGGLARAPGRARVTTMTRATRRTFRRSIRSSSRSTRSIS